MYACVFMHDSGFSFNFLILLSKSQSDRVLANSSKVTSNVMQDNIIFLVFATIFNDVVYRQN